jgi:seryl-tRNA synthetase
VKRVMTTHIKTLQGENETLKQQLGAAEARAEKQASDFAANLASAEARLAAEQAQTEKAIAAFSALAVRLDALAAERTRRSRWWRLVSGY